MMSQMMVVSIFLVFPAIVFTVTKKKAKKMAAQESSHFSFFFLTPIGVSPNVRSCRPSTCLSFKLLLHAYI